MKEVSVLGVGDLDSGQRESVDMSAVDGAFTILTGRGAHEEPGGGDVDEVRLNVVWRVEGKV